MDCMHNVIIKVAVIGTCLPKVTLKPCETWEQCVRAALPLTDVHQLHAGSCRCALSKPMQQHAINVIHCGPPPGLPRGVQPWSLLTPSLPTTLTPLIPAHPTSLRMTPGGAQTALDQGMAALSQAEVGSALQVLHNLQELRPVRPLVSWVGPGHMGCLCAQSWHAGHSLYLFLNKGWLL